MEEIWNVIFQSKGTIDVDLIINPESKTDKKVKQ